MKKEDITEIEIEKKFLLKNFPDRSLFKDFNSWTEEVVQSYYQRENGKWGRIEKVISSKEGLFYMQNWKNFISPGVCEETEFRITEEQYKEKYKDCVKYVYKTRTFIEYNDIVLEIDDFHNLKLSVLEVELSDINNEIEFPDWIKNLIISDVTEISNFSNEKLALPIENVVDYINSDVVTSFTNLKKSLSDVYVKYGDKKVLVVGRKSYSGNEIANEIKSNTKFGIEQVGKLLKLSINLISRDKISQDS